MIVYCPKCNSEAVNVICLTEPPEQRVSMDDLPLQPGVQSEHLMLTYHKWMATCADCSYSREWTGPLGELSAESIENLVRRVEALEEA